MNRRESLRRGINLVRQGRLSWEDVILHAASIRHAEDRLTPEAAKLAARIARRRARRDGTAISTRKAGRRSRVLGEKAHLAAAIRHVEARARRLYILLLLLTRGPLSDAEIREALPEALAGGRTTTLAMSSEGKIRRRGGKNVPHEHTIVHVREYAADEHVAKLLAAYPDILASVNDMLTQIDLPPILPEEYENGEA